MQTMVVAFGADESSVHALQWAAGLARRAGARLHVVDVADEGDRTPLDEGQVEERRRAVREVLARHGVEDADVMVCSGNRVDELVRCSEEVAADLLVVGRRGSTRGWDLRHHGEAETFERESSLPFVVVPEPAGPPRERGPLVVTVGVDGTPANAEAVEVVARIVEDLGARSEPVYVVDTGASSSPGRHGSVLQDQREAEQVATELPGAPPLVLLNEEPVDGLLLAAREAGADLIAVGASGHRSLAELVSGEFVGHLIDRADRAVLVAPHH